MQCIYSAFTHGCIRSSLHLSEALHIAVFSEGAYTSGCICMQQSSSPSSEAVLVRLENGCTNALDYDKFPAGTRVQVWWSGDRQWFTATVSVSRTVKHKVKGLKIPCREIYCVYELDDLEQWHSIHNNKIRFYDSGDSLKLVQDLNTD